MSAKLDVKAVAALTGALHWVYDKAVDGVPGLDSAHDLAASYRLQFASEEDAIEALIRWQIAKAAAAGFLTNLGGAITLPVALPANVVSALYIQVRMVAAIAALRGHDLRSDRVRTVVLACLCGTSLIDMIKEAGMGVGGGLAQQAVASLSAEALRRVKHAGRFELARRALSAVNVSKLAPLIGGLVAGALDGALTRSYGSAAKILFEPVAMVA
jgi:uncharacterized protein (DUF697 family)